MLNYRELRWITENWSYILWEQKKLNLMLLGSNFCIINKRYIVRFHSFMVFKVLMSSQALRMCSNIADKLSSTSGQVSSGSQNYSFVLQ